MEAENLLVRENIRKQEEMNKLPRMTRKYLNFVASRPILKKLSSIHNVTKFLECLGEMFSQNLDRFHDPPVGEPE